MYPLRSNAVGTPAVFSLNSDCARYTTFACVRSEDVAAVALSFTGEPMRSRWQPIDVLVVNDEVTGLTEVGDLSAVGTIPALSSRAADALRDLLEPNGELLPIRTPVGEYFAYNITRVVAALDRPGTDAEWFDNDRIMADRRLAFHPQVVRDLAFFRIPELRTRAFMTDLVAQRVRQTGLTGFDLRPLWVASV